MKSILLTFFEMKFSLMAAIITLFLMKEGFANDEAYNNVTTLSRGKRYLDIIKKSRIFFRANIKNNIVKVNQLWAHGAGFRANYPIEVDKRTRPFRRDVYEAVQDVMEHHGFDGRACILKSFCSTKRDSVYENSGMLFKLFKFIFTLDSHEKHHFPDLKDEHCDQLLNQHCPLSFNNILPFTDEV